MGKGSEKKPRALLLTGIPGVGKTTVLRKVAEALRGKEPRGFLTEEIRVESERVGFRIESLDGESGSLARVGFRSPHRVGRYGVDLETLERFVAAELSPPSASAIYLVDEIGKMECLSKRFREAIAALLDSGATLLLSVARKGGGFIAQVKARKDVECWEVTRQNRDALPRQVLDWLAKTRPDV